MSDNPDELFDIVDLDDRVIGQERRGEVHARKLLHRSVHILVQRENEDLFLQKRSFSKDCHPGCWDSSASGHLDSGEDYASAAERELREELGIEAEELRLIGKLTATPETGYEFVRIYGTSHEGPFTLHPKEILEGKWISRADLEDWLRQEPGAFAPGFHAVWQEAGRR